MNQTNSTTASQAFVPGDGGHINSVNSPVPPSAPSAAGGNGESRPASATTPTPVTLLGSASPDLTPSPAAALPIYKPAFSDQDCHAVRVGCSQLSEIDDAEGWQRDLVIYLLEQSEHGDGYDAHEDARLDGLIATLGLYARFFEVKNGAYFRHDLEKFDAEGFLRIVPPFSYTDRWWSSVPADVIEMAEKFFNEAGVIEFKEVRAVRDCLTGIRLRADLIVTLLKNHYPEKYAQLGNN